MNIREPSQFPSLNKALDSKTTRSLVGWLAIGCGLLAVFVLAGLLTLSPKTGEHQAPMHVLQKPKPTLKPFEFPQGGRVLIPGYRFVALYGSPDMPALGALGEQSVADSIARVQALAAQYQPLTTDHVYPTLEIIATIASAGPTENGDFSQELEIAKLQSWVAAARQAGVYVVLDLQPGRSDFLSQAKLYESLLEQPHVGLALDPEWRLNADQTHLKQIGSVNIEEINQVVGWLAELTKVHKLPQKLFVLQQFQLAMIQGRERLDSTHPELANIIQMDGSGSQAAKLDTWNSIMAGSPPNVNFGWKNFYHEDSAMLDPTATMAIVPQPYYLSYQ